MFLVLTIPPSGRIIAWYIDRFVYLSIYQAIIPLNMACQDRNTYTHQCTHTYTRPITVHQVSYADVGKGRIHNRVPRLM